MLNVKVKDNIKNKLFPIGHFFVRSIPDELNPKTAANSLARSFLKLNLLIPLINFLLIKFLLQFVFCV